VSATADRQPVGRRRRARDPEPRRSYQKVKVSEDEREQLRQRAAELGVSVPRLMVESALEGRMTPDVRRAEIAELFEIRRLLATVANNVNQLAKTANISGQVPERDRLEKTLGDVDELIVDLRRVTGARR